MRRLLPALLCVVVVAAVAAAVIAATGDRSEQPKSAAPPDKDARAALVGAPAPLAALHDQGNRLLDGGAEAFEQRLSVLKGYPVVVNMWGSWCAPCRAEFPYFQSQAIKRGKTVAFLGVDGQDSDAEAEEFLEEYPVAYPSYKDPDLKIAEVIKAVGPFPATVFYDRSGEIVHLKQGGYADERALAQDIGRYAR
ncbi:MAG: TlpA family protein disulfide reductase [Thermoleophilaceae bacterium]